MSLGKTLAEARRRAGLTQQQQGALLNVSAQAVSKWENDLAEPDLRTLCRLSVLYHTPIERLLTDFFPKAES